MTQKFTGSRSIVHGYRDSGNKTHHTLEPTVMTCNPACQRELRLEYVLRTAAVVLFLLLSPALVWSQTAVPDEQSGPAAEEQTQQSASTGGSVSQSDAGTQSESQTAV